MNIRSYFSTHILAIILLCRHLTSLFDSLTNSSLHLVTYRCPPPIEHIELLLLFSYVVCQAFRLFFPVEIIGSLKPKRCVMAYFSKIT